ncbi:LysR substrate-binding domain-containing protein [Sphingosinicella soli]|jgi:DNA-binding transcriptional LysR family regulator|uniref:DNA-binding transcriptional LysR family regulator n=1 Tax=Sphingosinicella soli TaxID=333708 RepID=A0A7W7AZ87_9SPHN|nr:LysR substrate-binding domain-containing protein [Sphingosinicella soli]MBB4631104.1 DNA-binding transcriptional LysR family regulator [Sphingosinicella soli]
MIDLLTLRLFALAAEHKSLSKTSAVANIAIAAISRRIANLEVEMGVRLFKRSQRGVELTPAGETCLIRTRNILGELTRLQGDMGDYRNGMRGRVSIWASTSAIAQFLPADLAAFSKEHPAIGLEIQEAYSAKIVSEVRGGNSDIGVILAGGETFGLLVWPYRCDRLAVVAPQAFRPGVSRVRFADLFDEHLVQMGYDTAMTRLLSAKANEAGEALRLRVAVDSFDAVCRMISAGFGIGILPLMAAASHVENSQLRLIELDEPWSVRQMLICTKSDVEPSGPTELLIDFLRAFGGK